MAEKDKDKNVPTTEQPQPQKSSNLLSMIGIANTVLIIGLVVYIVFIKKDPPAQVIVNSDKKTESQQNKDDKKEGENGENGDENTDDENKEMGETYELKGILVNLNEPGGSRMLKVSLTLEFKDVKFKDILKKRDSQIRSEILIYLSGLNFSQTVGVSQKENILKTLKKKINQVSVEGKIRNIFFSEFVVQ